jgi:hypothetical protein
VSTDAARWPRLKFSAHPVLDWFETEYTEARLLEIADAVRKHPHTIEARTAEGHLSFWNLAIEQALRALADSDAALKALNHRRKKPPARVIGLNRAVHVRVLAALLPGSKAAEMWQEVATIWHVSASTVKDDVGEYRVEGNNYRPDDAELLVRGIVGATCTARLRAGETRSSRDDVLEDFDKDMRERAEQLHSE